ncbi:hypothetical protein SUNI508_05548 [Seiridium unicorne]|uniref:Uncharacterized protein n=1 Tax=Seiridium unicorne TaxID=138068 RepID=A0ABR2V4S6_9PEZI
MADHGGDSTRSAYPQRPRHQISRSITEMNTSKLHRHHGHHLLQRRHQDRNSDRTPQSATPYLQMPARGSLDLPRSEDLTPYLLSSAEQSRRTSMLPSGPEDSSTVAPNDTVTSTEQQRQVQREQAAQRTNGLRKSLLELNTFSLATTRRLDDAYYAVLEKLSTLQSTVVGIKELATMSLETNETFKTGSKALVTEIESQLDAFGQFDEQQKHIENLQSRIYTGRQKVQQLSERVDIVRERVESWERADREWQERTRRRLKVLWIITSTLVMVMLLLYLGAQYASLEVGTMKDKITEMMSSNSSGISYSDELTNGSRISEHLSQDIRAALNQSRGAEGAVEEEALRALDEL